MKWPQPPKGGALKKGIEIPGRMIKKIRDEKIYDGIHIMAIGKDELVPDIMDRQGEFKNILLYSNS